METIIVPAPPKSAFNKNRRVSDLILHQLRYFQHVAQKSGMKIDPALERDIATEGGAARYIATVTREMRSQAAGRPSGQASGPRLIASPAAVAQAKSTPGTLDLAAAATGNEKPAAARKTEGASRKAKTSSDNKGGGKRKR